jgi:multidrug efflux system membrane fusion protein
MQQEIRSKQADLLPPLQQVDKQSFSPSMLRRAWSGSGKVHASTKARISRVRQLLTILMIGVLVVSGAMAITSLLQQRPGAHTGDTDDSVPVLADQAHIADVPVYLEGVGTVRALNMVTVHTHVDGSLISVNFREGQDVKAGDVLARIDPTAYQAQLDQAIAKKALDEAQLANARLDLERYTTLLKVNSISRQQAETTRALVAQLEAQVNLDQGAIDYQKAYFNWCSIIAPISGRAGIRLVDQGNIIHASDVNGIVVLTQLQPISVLFTLPQQQLGQVNKAFTRGPPGAEAVESDGKDVLDRGTLQVVNNQIDQTTGTVQLKAEFPNKDQQLWPGQFVNVRLLVDTLRQAVVVPTAAVQLGPNGTFVYVLNRDSTVSVRLVSVTQQNEAQAVIAKGLQAFERVVTSGFAQLTEGRKVAAAIAEGQRGADAERERGAATNLSKASDR